MRLSLFREPAPDEVLAKDVRDAISAYNQAVSAAKRAGLSVETFLQPDGSAYSSAYLGSRLIRGTSIARTTHYSVQL